MLNSEYYEPSIYYTSDSVWDENNPWIDYQKFLLNEWNPHEADLLFLAGMDWKGIPKEQSKFYHKPIINLIQSFWHTDSDNILNSFLSNRAIRICVSPQVEDALRLTGKFNGTIFTILNRLEATKFTEQKTFNDRTKDLLIVITKNPVLAIQIEQQLSLNFCLQDNASGYYSIKLIRFMTLFFYPNEQITCLSLLILK